MEKPKNNNYYFTAETEAAIVLYNSTSDPILRDRIFTKDLYYPFYKLAENLIHTFKFYYLDVDSIEHLKYDIISMVVADKLHRFDSTNGAKAFSYFQTIIKRWLINYNRANYKKLKQVGTFEETETAYNTESVFDNQKTIQLKVLVDNFVQYSYDKMDTLFLKQQEQQVADAVLTLFKTRYDIEIFRKKALYIYIREMTECETPTLTRVVNKLKEVFLSMHKQHIEAGYTIQ